MSRPRPVQMAMLGPMGPAQIACLSSWRRSGLRTHFLHTESQPLPRALWRIADRYDHIGPLGAFNADRAAEIGRFLDAAASTHLVCLADQVTLNLWRHLPFLGAGTILATAPADVIAAMESKTLQVELAQACGLDVLPTHRVRSDDWEPLSILPFPLVLRPDRASVDPSFKAEFVQDSGQLARFLGARGTDAPTVVAQPFVGGPNVVVHGARTRAGEMLALQGYIGRLKNDGVTVMLEPWPLTEQLARACREFAQRACLVGVFHFDLLLDPGTDQVWFLEVNARLGGTTAKVYASGYDEPRALLWAFGLSKAPDVAEHGGVPVVNRLAAARCAIRAIGGKGTPVDFPFPSRSAVFWQALRASLTFRDEVLRPLRPLGTLVFLSQYLR